MGEVIELEDNKRKPVKASKRIPGNIPYYGANGIQDYVKGYTHTGEHVLVAEDGANSISNYPVYFICSPSWINNHSHVLTGKGSIISNKFLTYNLKTVPYANYLVGSGRYKLNAETLKIIPIKLPLLTEQNYIGSTLSKIDKLITLQQRKLEQLKQLKKAMLQQLFVSKNSKQPVLRFKNFDSDWRQHSLEDISAKTYSGLTGKSKDDFGHGKARYITYLNVHNNEVAVSDGVEQIEVDSKQNKVLKGDLLFTISSEVPSEVALNSVWSSEAGTDIYLNSFCFGIRPKSNYVNSFFLTYYLRSPQMRKLIYPLAQGISRFNISKRSILALKINTPVLPEQISICKVLMHIDNLITYQQNKLTQLTTLKRYLLQKLFI
ncbi:MAG: restriction endonuclease subunit S [Anaeroplasmataceae bacterium]|nr:restriction endonuclease subunit S [Anaeroplasmataceae bacterium]